LVDLPEGMPRDIFNTLKKVWVAGQQLNISRLDTGKKPAKPSKARKTSKRKPKKNATKKRTQRKQ
ncbi:MAG: hypothetical protein PVG18_08440, partial [Thioalkalispiraceae bacterium]